MAAPARMPSRGYAMARSWRRERHERDIGTYLDLIGAELGEDQAGGGLGFGLEALNRLAGVEPDHGVFREGNGHPMRIGCACVGAPGAARTSRGGRNRSRAVHTDPLRSAPGIALPVDGLLALGRGAFTLQHRAAAAAGLALECGPGAAHAKAGGPAGIVATAVECAPSLAAGLADGAVVLRPATAAGRTETRAAPRPAPPPVAGAVGAPAAFRIAAAVELTLSPGPVASDPLGGAAFLGATAAYLEAGLGGKPAAAGADAAGDSVSMTPTLALLGTLVTAGHGNLEDVGDAERREGSQRHLRHRHGRTAVSSATCRAARCRRPRTRRAACPRRVRHWWRR